MGMGYFFMGLRCLLGTTLTFTSVLFGLSAILFPRLLFACIDYFYHWDRVRRGRDSVQSGRLSCCGTFTGYMATVFFPMSDPIWIFWFIWIETSVFILWGNIATWSVSPACLSTLGNGLYTGIFFLLFLIIPICLPYARASLKRNRMRKLEKFFGTSSGEGNDENYSTSTTNTTSTPNISTDSV